MGAWIDRLLDAYDGCGLSKLGRGVWKSKLLSSAWGVWSRSERDGDLIIGSFLLVWETHSRSASTCEIILLYRRNNLSRM